MAWALVDSKVTLFLAVSGPGEDKHVDRVRRCFMLTGADLLFANVEAQKDHLKIQDQVSMG